jgi:hypothetical protein
MKLGLNIPYPTIANWIYRNIKKGGQNAVKQEQVKEKNIEENNTNDKTNPFAFLKK